MSTGVVATWPWAGVQRWDGLWTIIFALVILWIAFGRERSEAFFDRARGG